MWMLLTKSCRRPLKNAFLESYGQHSKQTSEPGLESLSPRSKAGREVPAQPGRQPGCPKSSKFPLFKAIQLILEKFCACHGLEQGRPPLTPSLSRSILCALAAAGKALGSQETWVLGKPRKFPHFVGPWPVPPDTKVLFPPGQKVIWGEMLLPRTRHPPLPNREGDTQKCSTEELRTIAPGGNKVYGVWPP